MKNESGTKEDITMLDALQRLWHQAVLRLRHAQLHHLLPGLIP